MRKWRENKIVTRETKNFRIKVKTNKKEKNAQIQLADIITNILF